MTTNFSVTIHNMMPDKPSGGIHVPFQTIVMDPFHRPFTFGPVCCEVEDGSHIGLESTEDVAGVFVGNHGEFLVMSENQFVILTPKQGQPITLGTALFPKAATHVLEVGKKGKSYRMRTGSSIMAYNFESESTTLKTVTIVLGIAGSSLNRNDIYKSAQGALAQSLVYFNRIWHSIAPYSKDDTKSKTIVTDAFNPMPVEREKNSDMKLLMNLPPPLVLATVPSNTDNLPIVKALPLEPNKRQKIVP